jgi:hypothetical protein
MDVSLKVPGKPVVTVELARDVSQLRFMQSMNDLDGCLSIFSTSYPDQASVTKANNHNSLHDHQSMGGLAATYTETINLKEAQARGIPTNYMELKEVLYAHHRLLQVLLGEAHPVSVGFLGLVEALERIAMSRLVPKLKDAKTCAQYMFTIHTYMYVWLEAQGTADHVIDAEFASLARNIVLNNWQAPDLPPVLWAAVKPSAPRPAAPTGLKQAPTLTPPRATRIPVATPPEQLVAGVHNPRLAVRLLLQTKVPKPFASTIVPCLNWHVTGRCTTDCKYKEDHVPHSAAETAHLKSYLAEGASLQAANPSA